MQKDRRPVVVEHSFELFEYGIDDNAEVEAAGEHIGDFVQALREEPLLEFLVE